MDDDEARGRGSHRSVPGSFRTNLFTSSRDQSPISRPPDPFANPLRRTGRLSSFGPDVLGGSPFSVGYPRLPPHQPDTQSQTLRGDQEGGRGRYTEELVTAPEEGMHFNIDDSDREAQAHGETRGRLSTPMSPNANRRLLTPPATTRKSKRTRPDRRLTINVPDAPEDPNVLVITDNLHDPPRVYRITTHQEFLVAMQAPDGDAYFQSFKKSLLCWLNLEQAYEEADRECQLAVYEKGQLEDQLRPLREELKAVKGDNNMRIAQAEELQRLLDVENTKVIRLRNNRNQHRSNAENLATKVTSLQLSVANLEKEVQGLKRVQSSARQVAFDDSDAEDPTHYRGSRGGASRILNRDNTLSNPVPLH